MKNWMFRRLSQREKDAIAYDVVFEGLQKERTEYLRNVVDEYESGGSRHQFFRFVANTLLFRTVHRAQYKASKDILNQRNQTD